MRKYAEMMYGKVHSIFPAEDYIGPDFSPEQVRQLFAPDVMMVEITDLNPLPLIGWKYEGGVFKEAEGDEVSK